LQIDHTRLVLLALIGGHGASDVVLLGQTAELYGSVFLFASIVPEVVMNVLFLIASIAHFANDVTVFGSIALHVALVTAAIAMSREIAVDALLVYMMCIHLPSHFLRLYDEKEFNAMAFAAVVMAGMSASVLLCPAVFFASSDEGLVSFTKIEQAIVCGHVIFEKIFEKKFSH